MKKLIICAAIASMFSCAKKEEVKPIEQKHIPKNVPSKTPTYYYKIDSTLLNK